MRKLVLFMHVSLKGFAADANGGLDWISYDTLVRVLPFSFAEGPDRLTYWL
jgi:hypothetical protein